MDLQQVPKNDSLWTAFNMYRASDQTTKLKSEWNRTVFAENFEAPQAPLLSALCLKVIAENYKGRPIKLNLKPIQMKILYDFIDPELPIERCINIEDEYYWKRVYATKCTDKVLLKQKQDEKNVRWKNLVVTLKLIELVESTPYEIWIHEEMSRIARMASPFVTELKISKLQAMRETSFHKEPPEPSETSVISEEVEEEPAEEAEEAVEETVEEEEELLPEEPKEEPEYEYPVEDCHHVDLSVFRNLNELHSLTVEFLPPELSMNYHSRYFNFSYVDMQNLASGISELPNLKILKIRRSRMDCVKLSIMLETLKYITVEHLEFYYCQLDDECGESLYEFLISTTSLKHFDLSGNYFKDLAIDYLADGIRHTPSQLTFLGLSNNPITDDSLCNLINSLMLCKDLAHVNLSGVKSTETGASCLSNMVKQHTGLVEMEIIAVPMNGQELVSALECNQKIQQLLCQGCGLTLEEEFNIELLLRRNRYVDANPYIGDKTKTEAEINAFVSRIKNPILTMALASIERRKECRRRQEERGKSPPPKPDETEDIKPSGDGTFKYNADNFTTKDLDERVTLYGQTDTNFFKKSSKKKNQ